MNKFTGYRLVCELETAVSGKLLYVLLPDIADAENKIVISQRPVSEMPGMSLARSARICEGCIGAVIST